MTDANEALRALEYVQRYFDDQAVDCMDELLAIIRAQLTDPNYVQVPVEQVTEESVAEGAYWCATEIIEPYVQRFERPNGELPASLVESVQFLLDHWLSAKETRHD